MMQPETAHHFVFNSLGFFGKLPGFRTLISSIYGKIRKEESVVVAGLEFPNRVGLAAGFDKDALLFKELGAFGFGFVEIGTVTPRPQPGNPKPRLFRLPLDHALINRMGFNNRGAAAAAIRLRDRNKGLVIGGNIGKNKDTPNEKAGDDYESCFRTLFDHVDYFVVNVSSPNTPGLRQLQEKGPLLEILKRLDALNGDMAKEQNVRKKPVFLKIAPDLTDSQLDEVVDVVLDSGSAGIIATNTTVSRDHLKTDIQTVTAIGAGGLSGKPVSKRSTEVIRHIASKSQGKFAIIGVGGIHTTEDAMEKLNAGADLIQLYTGFVYEGPALIGKIRGKLKSGR